jgi:hypothetical protein
MSRDSQDADRNPRNLLGVGYDGIYCDAYGRQKVVNDVSVFNGLFTFAVSNKSWIEYFDGSEVPKTNATSVNGALKLVSNGGASYLMAKRHPRCQPNRGIVVASSIFLDGATTTNGKLYAVVRTIIDTVVQEQRNEVTLQPGYIPGAGNAYHIQTQGGIGNVVFFIGGKRVYKYSFQNKLSELATSNTTLPIGFEATSDGKIRYGMFNSENGIFFEWVFDTPQETAFRCGCVDMTSEGGTNDTQYFLSVIGNEFTATDETVLAIRVPNTFKGRMNTIDIQLARLKAYVSKKSSIEVWVTRDPTALTIISGVWEPLNGGNVEKFAPTASGQITFDDTKAEMIDLLPTLANINNTQTNPTPDKIEAFLTHGDIMILKINGISVDCQAIMQFGEEI